MGENFNKSVGTKLYNARKKKGMSRAELGMMLNVHETTVKRYEDGDVKHLDIEKLKEFASVLHVDPAYLMGWESQTEENITDKVSEICATLPKEKKQMLLAFAEFLKEYK